MREIKRLKAHLDKIEDRIRAAERRTVPTELDRFLNPSFGGNDSATARAEEARAEVAALRLERMELVYKIFQAAEELEARSAPAKPAGKPLPRPPRAPAMDTPPDPLLVRPGKEAGVAPP